MNLSEAMEFGIKTGDIIIRDDYCLSMIYSQRFNCFLWCHQDGRAVEDLNDSTGYKRVILSQKLLSDDYYLMPTNYLDKHDKEKSIIRKLYHEYDLAQRRQINGERKSGFMRGIEKAVEIVNRS